MMEHIFYTVVKKSLNSQVYFMQNKTYKESVLV